METFWTNTLKNTRLKPLWRELTIYDPIPFETECLCETSEVRAPNTCHQQQFNLVLYQLALLYYPEVFRTEDIAHGDRLRKEEIDSLKLYRLLKLKYILYLDLSYRFIFTDHLIILNISVWIY